MKYSLAALVLSIFLIASCANTGPQGPNQAVPFIGGNVGLEVGLLDGLPPALVYDNGRMTFAVGVALHNVGEANVGPGTENEFVRVSLEGFSPRAFGLTTAEMSEDLERPLVGSRKNFDGSILPGQLSEVIFEDLNYQDPLPGNLVQNIVVKSCYDYETRATAAICYKNEVFQDVEDICSLTGEKFPQNSGGPLQVTSLVQNPLGPHRAMVNFVVSHLGTGEFYGRDPDETCNPTVTNLNKFKVGVEVTSNDPALEIDCSTLGGDAEGEITLYEGAAYTVTCILENTDAGARIYTDPINVHLTYRYGEMLTQPIIIQAVGAAEGADPGRSRPVRRP